MDDIVYELYEYFHALLGRFPTVWMETVTLTVAAYDTTDRSGLTVEQKRDVQETLGILN